MTKKCSKALRARTVNYTNALFERCVREVLGLKDEPVEDLQTAMDLIRQAQNYIPGVCVEDEVLEMQQAQERVSSLYQQRIKELPTKHLNEILKVHNLKSGFKRAPKTIQSILNELVSRSILEDTSESDLILNNGDVDEPTKKSKINSSKAINKRRKASKDR